MPKRKISWAAREKRRQINKAISGSLQRTLTELITNSDSAIKTHLKLPHASGLIGGLLALNQGDRLDSAAVKASLPKRQEGKVVVNLFQAPRTFPEPHMSSHRLWTGDDCSGAYDQLRRLCLGEGQGAEHP